VSEIVGGEENGIGGGDGGSEQPGQDTGKDGDEVVGEHAPPSLQVLRQIFDTSVLLYFFLASD